VAENAYLPWLDRLQPDVVIVNSVPRPAWLWMSRDLRSRGIARVLYVRELHAVTHLTMSGEVPDLLIANSESHAAKLREAGYECLVIPSLVDRAQATVDSTRLCALLVNPIREHRIDLVLGIARARPDIPFVLQESWPLDETWRDELVAATRRHRNVELRERVACPAEVYRDARVLLVPYPNHRPRVVAEAQHNGIPVLAADEPALAEAVGPGGLLVGAGEPSERWVTSLAELWDDAERYAALSERARDHDGRPEFNPANIAAAFEAALSQLVSR
jgi:glycosyltransferase involved in cell wall biosynthesis